MERVGTLIDKLKEQLEQGASEDRLLITAQMLLTELQQRRTQPVVKGRVAVVMPLTPQYIVDSITVTTNNKKEEEPEEEWSFDPIDSVPTLIHQEQKGAFELNDVMVAEEESLNEKLKEEITEVANLLQGAPVRDLRKAIGLNDRYLFINELFRGDENMYERSIKTINAFSIYPEAEYWIQRELKVKIGWSDEREAVKLFDQLVRRRFS